MVKVKEIMKMKKSNLICKIDVAENKEIGKRIKVVRSERRGKFT